METAEENTMRAGLSYNTGTEEANTNEKKIKATKKTKKVEGHKQSNNKHFQRNTKKNKDKH